MKDSRWWYYATWFTVILYFICLTAFSIVSVDRTVDDMIFWGFMTTIMIIAIFGCITIGVLMEQNESYELKSRKKSAKLLETIEKRIDETDKDFGDHQSWPTERA